MTKLHCKVCKEMKVRNVKQTLNPDGSTSPDYYPASKNKKYIDENGRLWSGHTCADCQAKKSNENMKNLRFTQKLALIENNDDKSS